MVLPELRVDLDSETPVYRQIAREIRAALEDGRLRPGRRLPATRDLARRLGVNRNTVVAAYDLLSSEGLVQSHTGRGTFLSDEPRASGGESGRGPVAARDAWLTGFSRAVEGANVDRLLSIYRLAVSSEGISFASSFPDGALMPVDAFGEALETTLRERGAEVLGYGPLAGSPGLRTFIAGDMAGRGSRVSPDEVLTTNGSQQALELVFKTLLDPGDPIVVEDPTFTGALSALGALGARLVGVPVDRDGVRPDLLELALERHRPRLVYLQPTFHNPTTRVMSEARRREVLELATRYGCAVLEDDWAGDLRFEGPALPTLHALDDTGRVIYVSTFSKKLMPGLRIGWVVAPRKLLERLITLKQIEDCGTSPLLQEALHRFVEAGGLQAHLRRVLPVYRDRRDRILAAMAEHFPKDVRWTRPSGGLFVWVTLPAGLDSNELFLASRERGVLFSRGDLFHVENAGRETLRLTFSAVGPEEIDRGIATLGELMHRAGGGPAEEADRRSEVVPLV